MTCPRAMNHEPISTEAITPTRPDPAACPTPEVAGEIDRITSGTIAQTVGRAAERAERTEKRGGYRPGAGRPKGSGRKPKPVSVETVGDGTGAVPGVETGEQTPAAPAAPTLSDEEIKVVVDGLVGCVDEFGQALIEKAAFKRTQDDAKARKYGAAAAMGDKTQALWRVGSLFCVRRYGLNYAYAGETALAAGAFFWLMGVSAALREIRQEPVVQPKQPSNVSALP